MAAKQPPMGRPVGWSDAQLAAAKEAAQPKRFEFPVQTKPEHDSLLVAERMLYRMVSGQSAPTPQEVAAQRDSLMIAQQMLFQMAAEQPNAQSERDSLLIAQRMLSKIADNSPVDPREVSEQEDSLLIAQQMLADMAQKSNTDVWLSDDALIEPPPGPVAVSRSLPSAAAIKRNTPTSSDLDKEHGESDRTLVLVMGALVALVVIMGVLLIFIL
ncbi:MAG: hypothetical protein AUK47_03320 [Deltaproteobacteria bacterium CG2_30_63_29]|nr:MAG: hypothetical protein AUK47_03320 [Deltaproteobacteria bacterium CG2_30_63_29]PJB36000.1 MAG: hypothetical protein CO108_24405 [Deltaproteobacteria bacterium CG_4_9_14_3_um_filter_63_12]